MGLAQSAEPGLAAAMIRVTAGVFGTSVFMNGDFAWALFLLLVAHFVILEPLGVPGLDSSAASFGYHVTLPLIGVAYALLGSLQFWVLGQAELLPWGRYLAGTVGINLGPKPTPIAILINTLLWLVAVVGSTILYEVFVFTDPVLAVVLVIVIPAVCYLLLWLIYAFLLPDQRAIYGSSSNVLRSIVLPGAFHVIIAFVISIIVFAAPDTYNYSWVAAVILFVLLFIVVLAVNWIVRSPLVRPPRTGDMSELTGMKKNTTLEDVEDAQEEAGRGYTSLPHANAFGARQSKGAVF